MALLSLQNISIAFGGPAILDDLSLQVERKQRVCLLGRNGAGKSTLMKIIEGRLKPDAGLVQKELGMTVSYLSQDIPEHLDGTAFQIIAGGLGEKGRLIADYHDALNETAKNPASENNRMMQLQTRIDALHAWPLSDQIDKVISRMSLNGDMAYNALSGGQKRRVLLAAALVSEPDLLLLDEPTNHLDIESITWMEEFLLRLGITLLFVTHDRIFLKKMATRIIELDRGSLVDWSCDYDTFLQRKQAVLDAEEKEWERFDKKLAQEEIWIRKGIRARRTRDEGRVRALEKMREARKARREHAGNVNLQLTEAHRSGKLVLQAENLSFSYQEETLIQQFSTTVLRGDKVGIIGPNGCGKSTLLKLLLGQLQPQSGLIRTGVNLSVVHFDQLRETLDDEKTVWENVLPHGDTVLVNGRHKHIIAYLQDFLFTPDRAKTPVSHLSGGEKNRLLLARLFTRPANLLVLDEPTNDLDVDTLDLLEELLMDFKGTLLLISHDRAFINHVVTSTLVFTGKGEIRDYVGGYDDWLRQRGEITSTPAVLSGVSKKQQYKEARKARQIRKLTYKEQKELDALPDKIQSLEEAQEELQTRLADPEVYRMKEKIVEVQEKLGAIERELSAFYDRWDELEAIKAIGG